MMAQVTDPLHSMGVIYDKDQHVDIYWHKEIPLITLHRIEKMTPPQQSDVCKCGDARSEHHGQCYGIGPCIHCPCEGFKSEYPGVVAV